MKNLIAATLLLTSLVSNAALINFDEAVSGDLYLDDFIFDTGGIQTIRGTAFNSTYGSGLGYDNDIFYFNE